MDEVGSTVGTVWFDGSIGRDRAGEPDSRLVGEMCNEFICIGPSI